MREIANEEIKQLLLEIMDSFHDFCEKHGLTYYIMGGTLLGAVRHRGFIPWDDDIDVAMPRPDYLEFIRLTANAELDGKFAVQSAYTIKQYTDAFTRIIDTRTIVHEQMKKVQNNMGVFLDVFPIDGVPKTDRGIEFFFWKVKMIRRLMNYARRNYSFRTEFEYFRGRKNFLLSFPAWLAQYSIANLFGFTFFRDALNRLAMKNDYSLSPKIAVSVAGYGICEVMEKESFLKKKKYSFEGREYWGTVDYDTYLSALYGDYMTLPPVEERGIRHNELVFFWKD